MLCCRFNATQHPYKHQSKQTTGVYTIKKRIKRNKMEKTTQKIAKELKKVMQKKGITANKILVNTDLSKNQIYSVLRMGKVQRPNYTINTLNRVCKFLGVEITFKKL